MRQYFSKSKQIYIQKNDRVCEYHSQRQNWDVIHFKTASNFKSKCVDEMVSLLLKPTLNSDTRFNIGVTDIQFDEIIHELGFPNNPNKKQKSMIMAIRLYLDRLRHGHTFEQMSYRYDIKRRNIGKKIKCARNIFLSEFVPKHLNHECRNREWLKAHTTDLAHSLYCAGDATRCVIVLDGTYVYTCSTSNYTHQRKIYSGQKKRHLFRIMKFIAVDGTIIDCFGPYPATMNDAKIVMSIFEHSSFENILKVNDVILVDRGFRNAVPFLQKKKNSVKIQKGTNGQLTRMQSNKSRLVTKMRFAIETANGRMKNKRSLFQKIIPSILTPNLMNDYKIGAALMNFIGKPILCEKEDFLNIGSRMMKSVETENILARIINSKKFEEIQRTQSCIVRRRATISKIESKANKKFRSWKLRH